MHQKASTILSFAIIATLAMLKLGQHPIEEWDEARNAVNAIEMLRNGDWFNLWYAGQPDTWSTKPPLFIWIVASLFKLLGTSELSLRLPSAIAILSAFFFLFKTIRLYRSANFAVLTCILLASVKGLIGWHVGRTGDFDALLTCLLTASVFCFAKTVDFGQKRAALGGGLSLGLAFLTKGPAAAVLLPGMVLYAVFSKKTRQLATVWTTWAGVLVAGAFPVGWFAVQRAYGQSLVSAASNDNAFERLFSVDLWRRFTKPADGWKEAFDFNFIFYSLDKSFNLWHFVFFGFLAFGLFRFIKNRGGTWRWLLHERQRLLLLSLCLYLPLALFLAVAAKSNRWYLAPALPYVGIATMWGIRHFWSRAGWVKWAFFALLAFTLGRQAVQFWQVKPKPELATKFAPVFAKATSISVASRMAQDELCYLYFFDKEMRFGNGPIHAGEVLVVEKGMAMGRDSLEKLGEYGGYELLAKPK